MGASSRTRFLLVIAIAMALIQAGPANANAQTFVGPTFPDAELNLNDSQISLTWDEITSYSAVKEYGTGGFVKFSHNTTHVYALLVANMSEWIAIEFDSDGQESMESGNDAWIFYINEADSTVRAVDSMYEGLDVPPPDDQNDLRAEAVFEQNLVKIEVVRKFDTMDTAGGDYVFANASSTYITFASKEDHYEDRSPYYLQIQFTDVGSIDEVEVPKVVDWNERKDLLLFASLVGVTLFIMTHYIIRVRFRPLAHGSRFIDSTIMKAPKFKERWNTLLDRKPKQQDDDVVDNPQGGS